MLKMYEESSTQALVSCATLKRSTRTSTESLSEQYNFDQRVNAVPELEANVVPKL